VILSCNITLAWSDSVEPMGSDQRTHMFGDLAVVLYVCTQNRELTYTVLANAKA